ncbi:MAG TPA: TRAP transporter substrate-binding protein DctP [Geminicoccaceae bacterium]
MTHDRARRASITRRDALTTLAAAGAGLAFTTWPLGRPFAATTLTGVTYLPPSYEGLMWGMTGFVDRLNETGGGEVSVEFYDSGTLVKADEQVSALRSGTIDFMFHTSSYITRSFEILGITGLPGVVDDLHQNGERLAMGTPLYELINQELAKDNLFMLSGGGGIFEPEYIWSGAQKVASLDDLSGKRVRVVGYEASTALEQFGVAPVRIPSSETYLALQRGTVDAVVANISTVIGRSLQEQLKYVYRLPTTAFAISIYLLKDRWDGLDEPTRQALLEAAKWYDENSASHVNNEIYPNKYWPTVQDAGVEVIEASDADLERFTESSQGIWEWWKEQVGEEVGQRAIDLALGKQA